MGLLVDDDGHYRGWLAAFLCCCAAMNEDEYPSERERDKIAGKNADIHMIWTFTDIDTASSTESTYCKQPQLTALPSFPPLNTTPAVRNDKSDNDAGSRCDSRQSDPVSSPPKSFQFDPDYLLPQLSTNDTDNHGSQRPQSPSYDPISPTRRVRLNRSESIQKKGLVPLPLGPVVLRDTNEADYVANQTTASREVLGASHRHQGSDSTQNLLSNASLPPYLETRETPYQRCGRQSKETSAKRTSPTNTSTHSQAPSPAVRLAPLKANAPSPSLSASLLHHSRDRSNSSSHSTLVDQRPSRNTPRLQRKRSNQSKSSFGNTEDSDVEKEVLELNTIVEERRAENNKNRSPTGHVPAVAPSMEVRARSQTLTDIGSALSRPLATSQNDFRPATSHDKEKGGPQSSKPGSKVPGWLSSVTPTINATNTNSQSTTIQSRTTEQTTPHEPSYRLTTATNPTIPRNNSGHDNNDHPRTPHSASSSLTALDSVVAYTLEPTFISSSPTKSSKRHSRSLMITPLGKPPVIGDFVIRASDDHDHDGERPVGVAL